jgi:hypothetical protein
MLYNFRLIVIQIIVILLVQSAFASTVLAAQCRKPDVITSLPKVEQEDPDMSGEPGAPRRTQSSGTR